MFGMSYGPSAQRAPATNAEPGNPPDSNASATSAATSVPSRFAPIFARTHEPGVGPVDSRTSWRVMYILTGRPVFFDMMAAIGSM